RYPAGRLYNSLADVDTSDHSVRLALELDSGAPLRIGEVRIEGAQRFDTAVVERLVRLSGITPGSDYDLARLQDAQQRIADTGYFESVYVSVDPGVDQTTAPVVVQLREAQRQKLVLGIGGSTDSGARLSVEHTHHRVPGIGWRAVSKLQIERDDQQLSTEWSAPVDDKGWHWITSALAARQIDGFDTTTSQRLRLGQAQSSDALDRSFFLQVDRARSVNAVLRSLGTDAAEASLTANYAWTRRRFDNTPFPQRGYGLGLELGAGYTLVGDRRPFGRTVGRWLGYWPVGSAWPLADERAPLGTARAPEATSSRWGRLALRVEAGAVWAKADTPVPETQLFLTGGDTSVRGYALRDIGVAQADGGVSPGRYMTVGSAEWQVPLWRNGQRTPWEAALFVDGGSVAEKIGDLKARWGVGAGVRYNSPVGPLRLDLAYGVQPRAWRLHFNVGFVF
ncbi:MAG: autotransporter assembly complex protein TamA, partial [Hydrogenophaga sp.]|uniref:autotransporter assembly complex protein TamA n=1 Tax=Hydrogenophaga sp. TaxID=1904254 RepID=UPI003D9B8FEF